MSKLRDIKCEHMQWNKLLFDCTKMVEIKVKSSSLEKGFSNETKKDVKFLWVKYVLCMRVNEHHTNLKLSLIWFLIKSVSL